MSKRFQGCSLKDETRQKISASLAGNPVSEETRKKLSESLILAVAEGRHKGFQYSKHPFSEDFIESFLKRNSISYERQYIFQYKDEIGRDRQYFLDFYLPDYNLDLEVDGSFHMEEPQLSKDIIRDSRISRVMRVFRLKWGGVGSELLNQEMKRLAKFLNLQP